MRKYVSFHSVFYENTLLLKDNPVKALQCNIRNLSCTSGQKATWNCTFSFMPVDRWLGLRRLHRFYKARGRKVVLLLLSPWIEVSSGRASLRGNAALSCPPVQPWPSSREHITQEQPRLRPTEGSGKSWFQWGFTWPCEWNRAKHLPTVAAEIAKCWAILSSLGGSSLVPNVPKNSGF